MISFWDFSNAIYAMPGVGDECLVLQNDHGLDVNLVLFCVYASVIARVRLTEQDLVDLDRSTEGLRRAAIEPLRRCRTVMKEAIGTLEDGEREQVEQLRAQVKKVELAAERLEQEWLGRWLADAATPSSEDDDPKANLTRYLSLNRPGGSDVPLPDSLFQAAAQMSVPIRTR